MFQWLWTFLHRHPARPPRTSQAPPLTLSHPQEVTPHSLIHSSCAVPPHVDSSPHVPCTLHQSLLPKALLLFYHSSVPKTHLAKHPLLPLNCILKEYQHPKTGIVSKTWSGVAPLRKKKKNSLPCFSQIIEHGKFENCPYRLPEIYSKETTQSTEKPCAQRCSEQPYLY